ncbi:MAG: outer membrane protein assembly factor BamE [Thioalkalivibrio sp.]|nr:outer membrane protein assembly factor BamE [Thioalkalivibrio sp.]
MKFSRSTLIVSLMLAVSVTACSTSQPKSADGAPAKSKEEIKAEKVKAKEEAIAKKYPQPPAGSPLAKVTRGMSEAEVREILGPPTTQQSYATGKQWIPGYGAFAPDTARTEFVYKGLGLVTFNNNRYTGRLAVSHVVYDPTR